jgi:hypothetical protein
MKPRQTGVSIVGASAVGDVTTTELRLDEGKWPSEPLAPANVWNDESAPSVLVMELHRLVSTRGTTAIFESYGIERLPPPGGPYAMYAWFRPEQLAVVQDSGLRWRRRQYDGADDDYDCLLTWARINPGDAAYESDAGWISVDAYERLIRDDLLRLRELDQHST